MFCFNQSEISMVVFQSIRREFLPLHQHSASSPESQEDWELSQLHPTTSETWTWPIRDQSYFISTNERTVLLCVNQSGESMYLTILCRSSITGVVSGSGYELRRNWGYFDIIYCWHLKNLLQLSLDNHHRNHRSHLSLITVIFYQIILCYNSVYINGCLTLK